MGNCIRYINKFRTNCELERCWKTVRRRHLLKVFLDRDISSKMQVVLQIITVNIPHTMEITGRKPIGIKDTLGFRHADCIEQKAFEFIVRNAILLTGANIVVPIPKFRRHLIAAYALKQSPAIFYRCPLQDTADRHMEHDWVIVLKNSRIQYSRLP